MIEILEGLPSGIDGVRAVEKVSKEDYEKVFAPLLDDAQRQGRRLRFLYQFGPDFEGFTASGAWQDAKIGLRSMQLFEACAIVTDVRWIREASHVAAYLMPCPVRVFRNDERDAAVAWLESLPQGAGVSARLVPESEVLVVEVEQPLRALDFEAIATTADNWLKTHDALPGLVIHAREFPGWENIAGFLRHIRFIRNHHERVERVALCSDSKLATLAPRIGEHFVGAEVKSFDYDDLGNAMAWAGGSGVHPAPSDTEAGVETLH